METPASIRVVGVSLIPTILTTIDALPTTTPAGLTALVNVLPYVFVAVSKSSDCRSAEQSALKHEPNSGKPTSNFGYGNPEPSLGNQEGRETRRLASHVDEGIVQPSLKDGNKLNSVGCRSVGKVQSAPLWSNPHRITGLIRGKLKALFAYANPELSSKLFSFDKCVETIHPASASCGW